MDKNQQELFKMILSEALAGITEQELAGLIDTFVELYENKFGIKVEELEDDEPTEPDLMHTKEATEYLKKFTL